MTPFAIAKGVFLLHNEGTKNEKRRTIMYGQYPYGTPSYMGSYQNPYPYQRQNVTPQMQMQPQQQVQPQMQPQIPTTPQIQEVRHGTEDEIKGHIVYPNCVVYFIDYQKNRLYSKRADNSGMSYIDYFTLTPINADGSPIKQQEPIPQVDMGDYIKRSELEQLGFITMPQLKEILNSLTNQQNKPMGVKPNGTGNTK